MDILQFLGTDLLTTILVVLAGGAVIWIVWRDIFSADAKNKVTVLKKMKGNKQKILEYTLFFIGIVETLNAAYAGMTGHQMPFGLRLGTHGILLVASAVLLFAIWDQVKEAMAAGKVLGKLFSDYQFMTWTYAVSIIFNFFKQWMDVLGAITIGWLCLYANLFLMAGSTGEVELIKIVDFIEYTDGTWEVEYLGITNIIRNLPYMQLPLQSNTVITLLHLAICVFLGAMASDEQLVGKGKAKGDVTFSFEQMCGYYAANIFPASASMTKTAIRELLEIDPATKFINQAAMEEKFMEAIKLRNIVQDMNEQPAARQAASNKLINLHSDMQALMTQIEDKAQDIYKLRAAGSSGSSGP